mgnify:CR=1 FL=1
MLKQLAAHGKPLVLAALGSPYVAAPFPEASLRLTTYSTVPPSETALAKVLFGEIPAAGKLVVTLPE